MDYKQKYLKYKSKYFILKNQIGGLDYNELNEKCNEQIKKDKFNNCTYCHYEHLGLDNTNVKDANIDLKNLYRIQHPNKVFSVCTDHYLIKKYFEIQPEYKLEKYNDISFFEIPYTKENILNAELFYGLKSYKINCNQRYDIELYPKKIHTFCAEGNIVWVNKESKVGSTNVSSCMFAVIILNDDSKICIHHNVNDSFRSLFGSTEFNVYMDMNTRGKKIDYFDLPGILDRANVKGAVKKIYLISPDFKNFDGTYPNSINIIKKYTDLSTNIIKMDTYGDYDIIVDDNNNILNIKKN